MLKFNNFYVSIVLFAMVSICSFSKDMYPKLPSLSTEQRSCQIVPFESKGKYGFILIEYSKGKQKEKKIVKPVFEKTCDFEEGNLSRIKYNGHWGVIDKSMVYVLPPVYEDVIILSSNYIAASKNGKYGILNISGEETLPFEYVRIQKVDFKKNFYLVYQGNKVGSINATTGKIIPCEYDDITTYQIGTRVFCICKKSNLCGIRDEEGTIITPCQYDVIEPQKRSNITSLICKSSNHYGVLDASGKVIIPIIYDEVRIIDKRQNTSDLLYQCKLSNAITLYCDQKVIQCDSVAFLNDKLLCTKSHKKGLYSSNLETIVPIIYDEVKINSNYISVKNKGKYGAYSLSGEKLIDATCEQEVYFKKDEWMQYYDDEMYTAYLVSPNKKYSVHEQLDNLSSYLPIKYGEYYSSPIDLKRSSRERCAYSDEYDRVCSLDSIRLGKDINLILSSLTPSSIKSKAIFDFVEASKGGASWSFRDDGALYYSQALDSVYPNNIKMDDALEAVRFERPGPSDQSYYEVTDRLGNTYTHKILRTAESNRWHEHAMIYKKSTDDDIYVAIMKKQNILSEINFYHFADRIKEEANVPNYHIYDIYGFYQRTDRKYVFFAIFKEVVGSYTLVYDDPTYVNFAGTLRMVNSGRTQELDVDIHNYVVICDAQFNVTKVVPAPDNHYINFFEDNSFCFIPNTTNPDINNVLFYNSDGTHKFTYCPPDGIVFSNVVKYNNDFYMGGLTYTHGYVDFANPMLVKFDATTGQHLDTKYEKRKKAYIDNIYINGGVLYVQQEGSGAFQRKISDNNWVKSAKPYINLNETSSETQMICAQDFQWGGRNVSKISFDPSANVGDKWKDFFIIVPTSEVSKIELYPSDDNSNKVYVKCADKYAIATIEDGMITPFQFRTLTGAKKYQLPDTYKSGNNQKARSAQPKISERQVEQQKYMPILASLLEHPLGVRDLRWTDSQGKIEKYFADKYPYFTPCSLSCGKSIASIIKDAPYYYTKIAKFDVEWNTYNIYIKYCFRGNMLLARKIREDLIAYGFNEMSEFEKYKCGDFHDRYIKGIHYGYVDIALEGDLVNFTISIWKKGTKYTASKEQKMQLPIQVTQDVASPQEPSKTQRDDSKQSSPESLEILKSLLQHPLGNSNLSWSDPKAQQKTYLLSKYPNIEIRDEYILTLRSRGGINDVPVYYNSMREFRYNLDFKGSITMSYTISGGSDIAEKIRKDLIAYGFKMPEFSDAKVPSSTQYNCGVIQGVKYGWMSVTCYTTGIEIKFEVEK